MLKIAPNNKSGEYKFNAQIRIASRNALLSWLLFLVHFKRVELQIYYSKKFHDILLLK